jgi:ATP-binding cassette subfamily B protein
VKSKNNINIFKLTWKMILYRPWLFAGNVVLWTLIFAYNAFPSFIVREFFNRLSDKTQEYGSLMWLMALIFAAALARAVIVYLGGDAYVRFEFYINSLFRRNILESIFKKPGGEALKVSSGEALNVLKDDVEQATLITDALLDIIGFTVFSIIAVCVLVSINAYVTFFVFAPLIIVVIIAEKATHRIQKNRRESRNVTSDVIGMLGEIFNGIQAVKVSGGEKNIIAQLHKLNRSRHKLMLRDTLFKQLLNSVYQSTVSLGTGLILLLVSQSMRDGSFTIGDFALFSYYLTFVTSFTQRFGDFLAVVKQGEVSFERMTQFLQGIEPESLLEYKPFYEKIPSTMSNCGEAINDRLQGLEVKNLNYNYPDSKNGIENINFYVKKGTFTVLRGKLVLERLHF